MIGEKSQWLSKGIWGAILAIVASIVTVARLVWPDTVPEGLEETVSSEATLGIVMGVVGIVGGALAYFGRKTATKTLT